MGGGGGGTPPPPQTVFRGGPGGPKNFRRSLFQKKNLGVFGIGRGGSEVKKKKKSSEAILSKCSNLPGKNQKGNFGPNSFGWHFLKPRAGKGPKPEVCWHFGKASWWCFSPSCVPPFRTSFCFENKKGFSFQKVSF